MHGIDELVCMRLSLVVSGGVRGVVVGKSFFHVGLLL